MFKLFKKSEPRNTGEYEVAQASSLYIVSDMQYTLYEEEYKGLVRNYLIVDYILDKVELVTVETILTSTETELLIGHINKFYAYLEKKKKELIIGEEFDIYDIRDLPRSLIEDFLNRDLQKALLANTLKKDVI